jgi:hypothetical protein
VGELLVEVADRPPAASVHQDGRSLRDDGVPEPLKGHIHVAGVPEQELTNLPKENPQKIRLELRVGRDRAATFGVFLHDSPLLSFLGCFVVAILLAQSAEHLIAGHMNIISAVTT